VPSHPELYLTVEAVSGPAALERLTAALTAAPVASVLVRAREGAPLDATTARAYVDLIQARSVAALIEGDAQLARTLRADGVHLATVDDQRAAYTEAREILGSRGIIGASSDGSRHSAMALGEMGCEYVAFEGADRDEMVAWWSDIFVVPCVALGVASADEARGAAHAGADFIGVPVPGMLTVGDVQAVIRSIVSGAALQTPVEVA